MLEKLMTNPVAWAVLAASTIISVVLAIVFYLKAKERKVLTYCLRSSSLIRGKKRKLEKLSITYAGNQIDNLSVSRFTIWNSGNKTLNKDDIVATKEVTITALEENKILDAELIACSEGTNNFSVKIIDEHTVKVLFDYVDKKEGAVVQILHTGTNDTLRIDYKIKGGMPIKKFINETFPRIISRALNRTFIMKVFPVIFAVMVVALLVVTLIQTMAALGIDAHTISLEPNAVRELSAPESKNGAASRVVVGILWFYSLIYLVLGIPLLKRTFMIGMPRSLKKHSGFDN